MSELSGYFAARDRLNAVSPSFCLAKWTQVTLHLHKGLTHSCHHPGAHRVPLSELRDNPAALHNTREKIATRESMLAGKFPKECQYCWNIENLGKDVISDRYIKSAEEWSLPFLEQILSDPLNARISPKYVEVSFSRTCQFKCSYCSPSFSTAWASEVKKHGAYRNRENEADVNLLNDEFDEADNPYIAGFWKWWPTLRKELHAFRVTGGEPLLSPNTFRLLEDLSAHPLPELEFAVNSNLGVSRATLDRLLVGVKDLLGHKKIKQFTLYTSIEAWAERAEYIRFGLNAEKFWENLESILENVPEAKVVIMATFNALSVSSFTRLLEKILTLREKYFLEGRGCHLAIDISYLRNPPFMAVNILTPDFHVMARKSLEYMKKNSAEILQKPYGFSQYEILKMERLCEWMANPPAPATLWELRAAFYQFFSQHDQRRGSRFASTFPEMSRFFNQCRNKAYWQKYLAWKQPLRIVRLRWQSLRYRVRRFVDLTLKRWMGW